LEIQQEPQFKQYIEAYAKEWDIPVSAVLQQISQNDLINNLSRDGTKVVKESWLSENLENMSNFKTIEFKKPFKSSLKNAMYQDLRYTKIPRSLRFNDRVSMAFSKELRVPFLDHRLFELTFTIPDKVLFMDRRPKGILRRLMKGILPEKVRLAPKRHIQTPQNEWFKTSLRSYVGDVLHSASFKNGEIFDSKKVLKSFQLLEGKPLENSFFIWQVVNIETWFNMFIDSPFPSKQPENFPSFDHEILNSNNSAN